jgi:hypothetical protein
MWDESSATIVRECSLSWQNDIMATDTFVSS